MSALPLFCLLKIRMPADCSVSFQAFNPGIIIYNTYILLRYALNILPPYLRV